MRHGKRVFASKGWLPAFKVLVRVAAIPALGSLAAGEELDFDQLMELGESVYNRPGLCAVCHQADGKGNEAIPPLAGSSFWVEGDPERLIKVVAHGVEGEIKVAGAMYDSAMPAQGPLLRADEIAGVLTYIRNAWGNEASSIDPELVRSTLVKVGERNEPWEATELSGRGTGTKKPFEYDAAMMLKPEGPRPVVYRNYIEGVGPRGIAVGYPQNMHFGFDPESARLALFWHGAFFNPGRHWYKRGGEFTPPAGYGALSVENHAGVWIRSDTDEAWPSSLFGNELYNFDGYEFIENELWLNYRYEEVAISESIAPSQLVGDDEGWYFERRIKAVGREGRLENDLLVLVASGESLRKVGNSRYRLHDVIDISIRMGEDVMLEQEEQSLLAIRVSKALLQAEETGFEALVVYKLLEADIELEGPDS